MYYPAYLFLGDQVIYKGWSLFKNISVCGELVFNTGMTGYQEIMTDPSYSGQIIIFTYPELGNTGLNRFDNESSKIHVKGIIAKNICLYPSNWRCNISLKDFIIKHNIPHIFGIDTRSLTKYIASNGVCNVYISNESKIYQIASKQIDTNIDWVKQVTIPNSLELSNNYIASRIKKPYIYSHLNYKLSKVYNSSLKILIIDFGIKFNIINRLISYGCEIVVVPYTSSYNTIKLHNPDGILLSNGPGDPAAVIYGINLVKKLIKFSHIPIFGICMGHQILNLAFGTKTFKLKFGHRGLNQPIGIRQKSEITSQNHGFAVQDEFVSEQEFNIIRVSCINFNDNTVAGILHLNKPIFSVQHHPEASPGPHDSEYVFKVFVQIVSLIQQEKNKIYQLVN
uniref:Carbamoyl phosphate synthase small chain n=1 Tax=Anotrichium furcellatum TaxID=41999 RepID=A0A4D6WL27_9FLOR|nr:Carbamoyl phosphate synthase small subunit [Anotrichium furcellatum]